MKTETDVTITMGEFIPSQNLASDSEGFLIKVFFSCSRVDSKTFKIDSPIIKINETLHIKNIIGKQIELWLCTTYGKLIAISSFNLMNSETNEINIDFKLVKTHFATLSISFESSKRQIEKPVIIEADQQLLKQIEDPLDKLKKQEQQKKKAKQLQDQMQALKVQKKPTVTFTQYSKKDQPFI